MVVLDCEGAVVEYYKNKTCIKTAMLMVYDKPKKRKKVMNIMQILMIKVVVIVNWETRKHHRDWP